MPEQVVELYVFNHKIAERLTSAVMKSQDAA